MDDEYVKELHILARKVTEGLENPDKKQLRYNDIVTCAQEFYNNPKDGIIELVQSCDKSHGEEPNPMYVKGSPMWRVLSEEYKWMISQGV